MYAYDLSKPIVICRLNSYGSKKRSYKILVQKIHTSSLIKLVHGKHPCKIIKITEHSAYSERQDSCPVGKLKVGS